MQGQWERCLRLVNVACDHTVFVSERDSQLRDRRDCIEHAFIPSIGSRSWVVPCLSYKRRKEKRTKFKSRAGYGNARGIIRAIIFLPCICRPADPSKQELVVRPQNGLSRYDKKSTIKNDSSPRIPSISLLSPYAPYPCMHANRSKRKLTCGYQLFACIDHLEPFSDGSSKCILLSPAATDPVAILLLVVSLFHHLAYNALQGG